MGKNDYTKKDAAKETKSTVKDTSRAWHGARDDAQQSNHPVDQNLTKDWGRTSDTPTATPPPPPPADDKR